MRENASKLPAEPPMPAMGNDSFVSFCGCGLPGLEAAVFSSERGCGFFDSFVFMIS
jgi:hypothetical protein